MERGNGGDTSHFLPSPSVFDGEGPGVRFLEFCQDIRRGRTLFLIPGIGPKAIYDRETEVPPKQRLLIVTLLTPCLVLLVCSLVSAATYFVAPDGRDENAGTAGKPWATLRHASQRVKPGDIVKVRAGRYRQTNVITDCRGTEEQPIVFEADGGTVALDGSEPVTGWTPEGGARYSAAVAEGNRSVHLVWGNGRLLLGPSYRPPFDQVRPARETLRRGQALLEEGRLYVRLFDDSDPNHTDMRVSVGHCLLLQGTQHTIWRGIGTAWGLNGYKLEAGSSHNLFTDAELHHHAQGILEIANTDAAAPSQFNTFQRLHIHHVGLTKFEHGIYTSGVRTRVLNCRFDHITGAAIHAYPEPFQGEYDGNMMTDPSPTYYPENFQGDRPPEPVRYYSAFICWGNGGHRVTNNLIVGPFGDGINVRSSGNWFGNNTIVLQSGPAVFMDGADNWLVNNILQTSGFYMTGRAPAQMDYNGYFGGKGWSWEGSGAIVSLAELQKTGKEKHGIVADPRFVDALKGEYRLAPASPLRDIGWTFAAPVQDIAGTRRPQGKGTDLGAYEEPSGP
jgi:hypothetical protein